MSFAKCNCKACSGHIEFDTSHAGQTVNCPHCGLETALYLVEEPAAESSALQMGAESKRASTSKPKTNTFGVEKLVFGITRMFVLGLAVLVVIGLVLLATAFFLTLKEERQQRWVSYEEISVSFVPGPASASERRGGKQHAAPSVQVPQLVLDEFSTRRQVLDGWLDSMDKSEQEQFLQNLSEVISKAQAAGVGRSKMSGVTERYREIWDAKAASEKSKELARLSSRAAFASSAFGLLVILTLLSIVLVLLAIERNTRANERGC